MCSFWAETKNISVFNQQEGFVVGSPTLSTSWILARIRASPLLCSTEAAARRSSHVGQASLSCSSRSQVVFLQADHERHHLSEIKPSLRHLFVT